MHFVHKTTFSKKLLRFYKGSFLLKKQGALSGEDNKRFQPAPARFKRSKLTGGYYERRINR